MKKILLSIMLLFSGSYASAEILTLSNEKLYQKYNELRDEFQLKNIDVLMSPLVCGISFCKSDIIQNGMQRAELYLRGEQNSNGAIRYFSTLIDPMNTFKFDSIEVCLSNDECKKYHVNDYEKSEVAFNNNEFSKSREKRKRRIPRIRINPKTNKDGKIEYTEDGKIKYEIESPNITEAVRDIVERWGSYFSVVGSIHNGTEPFTGAKIDDITKNLNRNNSIRNADKDTSVDRRGPSRSAHHGKIVDRPIGGNRFGNFAR